MGLLNFLKKKTESIISIAATPTPKLTNGEIAFLQYSAGHDTDISTFSKQFLDSYDLDYDKTIQKLLNAELLCVATAEDSLKLYKTDLLKDFLKQKGLSTTGKKDVLIERIITQTTDFSVFFSKRAYALTNAGKILIEDYNTKKTQEFKCTVSTTISSIRNGDLNTIYPLYESTGPFKNPIALPYDKSAIKKDIDAINQYRNLGHNSDRDLATCVVSVMMHRTFKGSIDAMKILGYEDVHEDEVYTATASIINLRNISTYKDANIEKYRISSCGDDRVCSKCREMEGKIFSLSKAQLGKTIPPFCSKCRCIIHPVFKF